MYAIQGEVQNITSKEANTRFGKKPVYSLQVNGTIYEGLWKVPPFGVGSIVSFNANQGKYGWKVEGEVSVIQGTAAAPVAMTPAAAPPAAAPAPQQQGIYPPPTTTRQPPAPKQYSPHGKFPIDPEDGRQMTIAHQSSVKIATEIVLVCVQNMSEAKKKALTPQALLQEILSLVGPIVDCVTGQDIAEEIVKERSARYQEYNKIMAGEQEPIDPTGEPVDNVPN